MRYRRWKCSLKANSLKYSFVRLLTTSKVNTLTLSSKKRRQVVVFNSVQLRFLTACSCCYDTAISQLGINKVSSNPSRLKLVLFVVGVSAHLLMTNTERWPIVFPSWRNPGMLDSKALTERGACLRSMKTLTWRCPYHSVQQLDASVKFPLGFTVQTKEKPSNGLLLTDADIVPLCGDNTGALTLSIAA